MTRAAFSSSSAPRAAAGADVSAAAGAARRAALLAQVKAQVPAHADAFYVVDLAEVAAKYAEWKRELPRV
jgi:hypothetical protein